MEQHLPEASSSLSPIPHPTDCRNRTQKFDSIGNSLANSGKAGTLSSYMSSDRVLSDVLFLFLLLVEIIFLSSFACRADSGSDESAEKQGAPLKRAGNHHLYNCFNLDIQIAFGGKCLTSLLSTKDCLLYCNGSI